MEESINEFSSGDDVEGCKIPLQAPDIDKRQDPGGETDSKPSFTGRPCYEYADTSLALLIFLALGFNFSILCQTLIDLERITNANTNQISGVFLWRGIGQSLACLFLGFLYDYVNHNFIISFCLVLISACQASMPYQTNPLVLSIIFGIQSVGIGLASVGVTLTLVRTWRTKSGPFLQAQYLMYVIAGCLSPLIINTFVGIDVKSNTSINTLYVHHNDSILLQSRREINDTVLNSPALKYSLDNVLFSGNSTKSTVDIKQANLTLIPINNIIPVYLLCTGYMFIISVMCMLMAFIVGPIWLKMKTNAIKDTQKNKKCQGCDPVKCSSENVLKVAMFTAMMTLEACIDCTCFGLIISFLVKELHWLEEDALYISSVLFFTSGATRFLAVIVSRFVPNVSIIIFDCVLGTVAAFILATLVHHHHCVIWVCVIALGAAYSTIMPSTVAWAGNQIKITGIITSIFMTPLGTGLIFGPRVVGFFFQRNGPMWFAFMLCMYVVALDVFLILTYILCKIRPLQSMDRVTEVKEDMLTIDNT